VTGLVFDRWHRSTDVKNEVGKTSDGAVRENLGRFFLLLAANGTVPMFMLDGGGMRCTLH